jgi:hypothetical protein
MQPLWVIDFRARCERNGEHIPVHRIIVDAPTAAEAKQRAEAWFKQENPCTNTNAAGTIRFVGTPVMLEHLWIYENKKYPNLKYEPMPAR